MTLNYRKYLNYIEIGRREGAKVACGGSRITNRGMHKGCFVIPTILADVDNKMVVAQQEIFSPVVCFIRYKNEQEVIEMANDVQFGLGGGVWTNDINRALRVANASETGRMWINNCNEAPSHTSFGSYKKSGIGREIHKMALNHYIQHKNIYIGLNETKFNLYQ